MKPRIKIILLGFLSASLLSMSAGGHYAMAQRWPELPDISCGDSQTVLSVPLADGSGRSFTCLYDSGLRISLWVAYPLNAGLIGQGSRGDGWHPADGLREDLQPVLYKGFAYGSGYDRGHQIPSADRLWPKDNDNTFTFINATPQLHDFNGGWMGRLGSAPLPEGFTEHTSDFDTCYGWERVMMEAFDEIAPYLADGSKIVIYPDSGADIAVVKGGKAEWS